MITEGFTSVFVAWGAICFLAGWTIRALIDAYRNRL